MNPEKVLEMVAELRMLPFFPNDEIVMAAILRLIDSMCSDETQVRWLVTRLTSGIYSQWPGPAEMRACFCCRYKPKDGLTTYSTVYPDGLPPDPSAPPRIAAPDFKALPEGHHEATLDVELEESIRQLADKCRRPPAHPIIGEFAKTLREIRTPPPAERQEQEQPINLNFKPITQEDIDHAIQELHERRAREAAEPKDAGEEKVIDIARERRKP